MKRPKPIEFEELVCRAKRPPTARQPHWYWVANLRGGERPVVWTGRGSRANVRSALIRRLADGEALPIRKPPSPVECKTVADLLHYWWGTAREHNPHLSERTKASNKNAVRRLKATVGSVAITRVSKQTFEEHRTTAAKQGYSTGSIRTHWAVLYSAIRWGKTRGLVDGRINVSLPTLNHQPEREAYVPNRAEVSALLGALTGWRRIAVLLLSSLGARRDEVGGLRWADVSLRSGGAWIRFVKTKTKKSRTVPLPPSLRAELLRWKLQTPGEYVLGVKPVTARSRLREVMIRTCRELEIPPITAQSLRRYAEREMSRAKVGVEVFAAVLGHSPAVALKHYLRPTDDDLRAGVAAALADSGARTAEAKEGTSAQ